jgi:hypothetical protein
LDKLSSARSELERVREELDNERKKSEKAKSEVSDLAEVVEQL